jgi:hypothetical protein
MLNRHAFRILNLCHSLEKALFAAEEGSFGKSIPLRANSPENRRLSKQTNLRNRGGSKQKEVLLILLIKKPGHWCSNPKLLTSAPGNLLTWSSFGSLVAFEGSGMLKLVPTWLHLQNFNRLPTCGDLADSLGWPIAAHGLSDYAVSLNNPPIPPSEKETTFASTKSPGLERAVENLVESFWWSKHLAMSAATTENN